jgi:hypothetical protein
MPFLHWRLLSLNIFLELFLLMDERPLLCMRRLRLRGALIEWTLNHTLRDRTCHQLGVLLLIWPSIRDWKLGQTAVRSSLLKGDHQLGIVPRPPDDLGLCQQTCRISEQRWAGTCYTLAFDSPDFLPWSWKYVPPKRRFTCELHGAISQKMAMLRDGRLPSNSAERRNNVGLKKTDSLLVLFATYS